jgi:hypothetical protein
MADRLRTRDIERWTEGFRQQIGPLNDFQFGRALRRAYTNIRETQYNSLHHITNHVDDITDWVLTQFVHQLRLDVERQDAHDYISRILMSFVREEVMHYFLSQQVGVRYPLLLQDPRRFEGRGYYTSRRPMYHLYDDVQVARPAGPMPEEDDDLMSEDDLPIVPPTTRHVMLSAERTPAPMRVVKRIAVDYDPQHVIGRKRRYPSNMSQKSRYMYDQVMNEMALEQQFKRRRYKANPRKLAFIEFEEHTHRKRNQYDSD